MLSVYNYIVCFVFIYFYLNRPCLQYFFNIPTAMMYTSRTLRTRQFNMGTMWFILFRYIVKSRLVLFLMWWSVICVQIFHFHRCIRVSLGLSRCVRL